MANQKKELTSIRISPEAKGLWKNLADSLSISQSAVLEMALRDLAIKHKVELP